LEIKEILEFNGINRLSSHGYSQILSKLRSILALALLEKSKHASSISLGKMSTGPSHLVQGCSDKETITLQSLLNGSEEFPPPQIDVLVGFSPDICEQGYFRMEIDDVSHRPTFIKTVDLAPFLQNQPGLLVVVIPLGSTFISPLDSYLRWRPRIGETD
jgi:hypothetical protein